MNIGGKMKSNFIEKIILIIFFVSIVSEVAITVSYGLLSNMDTNRFQSKINISVIDNK